MESDVDALTQIFSVFAFLENPTEARNGCKSLVIHKWMNVNTSYTSASELLTRGVINVWYTILKE